MDKKVVIIFIIIGLVIAGGIFTILAFDWFRFGRGLAVDFEDCVKSGFPIEETFPRQCRDKSDKVFVEDAGNILNKANIISLNNPKPNQEVTSPLVISGQARGWWFFEGSFPIKLKTVSGRVLNLGSIKTKDEWMTDDFVNFSSEISFAVATRTPGFIELIKDNPSGLPEKDDSLYVPVVFMPKMSDNILK